MIKRLKLTEDHIKLISLLRYEHICMYADAKGKEKHVGCFIDDENPYILSGRLSDLALALGMSDKAIPGTDDTIEGAAFPDDVEEYLLNTHHYIVDNLCDIEELVHQMITKGGITAGTYKCIDTEGMWEKEK